MEIDIKTLFFMGSIVIFINSLILLVVWYKSKEAKFIIQYFTFSLLMTTISSLLIILRGVIPDFLSIVLCNLCFSITFYTLQKGVCSYIKIKSPLSKISKMVLALNIICISYYTYIEPSFYARVITYSAMSFFYCSLSIYTIKKSLLKNEEPLRLLKIILYFELALTILRIICENPQNKYFSNTIYSAVVIIGYITIASTLSLCYLWIALHYVSKVLKNQAEYDFLTQIANRQALEHFFFKKELSNYPLESVGVIWIDIDNFKFINDEYGHYAGDLYLEEFSKILRSVALDKTYCFRYGGDEFILICLSVDKQILNGVLSFLQKKVKTAVVFYKDTQIQTTISLGVALNTTEINTWQEFLHITDDLLYEAKKLGKNRFCKNYTISNR